MKWLLRLSISNDLFFVLSTDCRTTEVAWTKTTTTMVYVTLTTWTTKKTIMKEKKKKKK